MKPMDLSGSPTRARDQVEQDRRDLGRDGLAEPQNLRLRRRDRLSESVGASMKTGRTGGRASTGAVTPRENRVSASVISSPSLTWTSCHDQAEVLSVIAQFLDRLRPAAEKLDQLRAGRRPKRHHPGRPIGGVGAPPSRRRSRLRRSIARRTGVAASVSVTTMRWNALTEVTPLSCASQIFWFSSAKTVRVAALDDGQLEAVMRAADAPGGRPARSALSRRSSAALAADLESVKIAVPTAVATLVILAVAVARLVILPATLPVTSRIALPNLCVPPRSCRTRR